MTKRIFAAEISFENLPAHIIEILNFDEEDIRRSLNELQSRMDEVFILATYNRFLVYAVDKDISPLVRFFSCYQPVVPYVNYITNAEDAINHLFAIASGLCSRVKGENRILNQLESAYELAQDCSSLGLVLDNLVLEAIRVGRKVRNETGLDDLCNTVVEAGFSLLHQNIENFNQRRFLVVGTDRVACLSLDWLKKEGVRNIVLASHNINTTNELAERYDIQAMDISEVYYYFHHTDVIIGNYHQEIALCPDTLSRLYHHYLTDPRCVREQILLDFGMPCNFDSILNDYPWIKLFNLDDLKARTHTPLDGLGVLDKAWSIVINETSNVLLFLKHLDIATTLSSNHGQLHQQVFSWIFTKDVSTKERELISRYSYKFAGALQHFEENSYSDIVNRLCHYNVNFRSSVN